MKYLLLILFMHFYFWQQNSFVSYEISSEFICPMLPFIPSLPLIIINDYMYKIMLGNTLCGVFSCIHAGDDMLKGLSVGV